MLRVRGSEAPARSSRSLVTAVRTRALWFLLRTRSTEQLRALQDCPAWAPVDRALRSGEILVLGGMVPRLRLSGRHFDYCGVLARSVLTGLHEPMVQEALRRTVAPGGVVLDLGAHFGTISLIAAWLVGPQGTVISVEPQRECVEGIEADARLNGFAHIRVIQAAVGAASGMIEVVLAADSAWTISSSVGEHPLETGRAMVRAVAVDDLIATGAIPPPDVVKIDVEGSEVDVIAGMERTLTETRPRLIAEMHDRTSAFSRALEPFRYEMVNLDGPEPIEQAGPNVHLLASPLN